MNKPEFREYYARLSDGELAKIASSRRSLVPEAKTCLDLEIAHRGLTPEDIQRFKNFRHSYRDAESPLQRKIKRSKLLSKVDELRKIPALGWRGILAGIGCSLALCCLFDYFGVLNAFMPVLCTGVVLYFTLRYHWESRRRPWFWLTVGTWFTLHVWMIVRVHWPSRWIPGRAWAGAMTIDLTVLFVLIAAIEKLLREGRFAPKRPPNKQPTT